LSLVLIRFRGAALQWSMSPSFGSSAGGTTIRIEYEVDQAMPLDQNTFCLFGVSDLPLLIVAFACEKRMDESIKRFVVSYPLKRSRMFCLCYS